MSGLYAFLEWNKDFLTFLEFTELKNEKPRKDKQYNIHVSKQSIRKQEDGVGQKD